MEWKTSGRERPENKTKIYVIKNYLRGTVHTQCTRIYVDLYHAESEFYNNNLYGSPIILNIHTIQIMNLDSIKAIF